MTWIIGAAAFLVGTLALGVLVELTAREVEGRLDRLPWALLRLARRRLPADCRTEIYDQEWAPELQFILDKSPGMPITRCVHGVRFAFGLIRAAAAIGRALTTEPTQRSWRLRLPWQAGIAVLGLLILVSFSFDLLNGDPVSFGIAFVFAVAPVPLLVAVLLFLRWLAPAPGRNLLMVFLWGAGLAVLTAGILNSLNLIYMRELIGDGHARNIVAIFLVPPVEETLKGLILLGLLWFRRHELHGFSDSLLYAAIVGLGFAMSENVSYYLAAMSESGAAGLAATVVLRGVISPLAHPLFTSLIGAAVGYAVIHRGRRGALAITFGWLGAVLLHAMWNGFANYGGLAGLIVAYLILMALLAVEVVGVVFDQRRVLRLIPRHMGEYARTDVLGAADLAMLSSLRGRWTARSWARAHLGRTGARRMRVFQDAATSLCLLHERQHRGRVSGPNLHKHRDQLASSMAIARESLQR